PTVQFSMDSCGKLSGAGGYKRSVSLIIDSRYFSFFKSDTSTILLLPISVSNSLMASCRISRLLRSKDRAHANVLVVVSEPAIIKDCKI
ncbi:hypothetical protein VIGAN_02039600, partial [Vigna angularis var. angularis]